ncbi:PREDICTED: flavonoid 3'-monooxygenase-like [Nelumbo nucifera]|uniref:Flavonoid 3'-monooxygenase-like n=1 Tax=Nelumbo nucifera TaxID=4432 RepID=A0A1U8A9S2_NELNU|nr:PREDICTED: flavonoid 3'-monooxygenase-like [Nelumbo nucifera]XP_010264180.1 PREDICTED: flavonoid 3'-monooxygenase-like [Nelumbo nucifera]
MITKVILPLLVTIICIAWYKWVTKDAVDKRSNPPLPSGPRDLPLVGSLPFLSADLHRCFAELAQTYGPIMKIQLGGKLCIVVSSSSLAGEIMRDHETVFVNRDVSPAADIFSYGGSDMVFSLYGPQWRAIRSVCVKEMLNKTRLDACYSLRRREARGMLSRLYSKVGTPINVGERMFETISNVIMSMLWGGTLNEEERSIVGVESRKATKEFSALLGRPDISDLFPVLAWFDIQGVKRKTKRIHIRLDQLCQSVIDRRIEIERQQTEESNGQQRKDLVQFLLQLNKEGDPKRPMTSVMMKALLLDVLLAGSETSATTVEWAMAEMMQHPEILRKVQVELEEVVGMNNVVEESHLPKLQYLNAVIKETLRLHTTLPLILPRRAAQTCIIGGYTIPEGARVFVNLWAIHRDPTNWDNPSQFQPERFLNETNNWDFNGNDFRYFPFGSGKRICVGVPMARRMVPYILASLLHSFDWKITEEMELDLSEKFGLSIRPAKPVFAIPTPRLSNIQLYV